MSSTDGEITIGGLTLTPEEFEVVRRIRAHAALDPTAPCVCCLVKPPVRYKRSINLEWCSFLKSLVDAYSVTKTWVHARSILGGNKASTDGTYLRHWGYITPKPRKRSELSSGFWIPTQLGIDFVNGKIEALSFVVLVDNEPVDWSSEWVHFDDCIKTKFQIDDVLSERA